MSRRHPRSSLPRRQLRRESDKTLYDLNERRRVEMSELCDDVRSGRYFRVTRHTSGEDCTQEVLAEVIVAGVPKPGTGGAGAFASMVSNVMTGLIGGIGANGEELGSREKRTQRPGRSASSSLGVGPEVGEQPPASRRRGIAAATPLVRDSAGLDEQLIDQPVVERPVVERPVVEQRPDRQRPRRATRRKVGLSDAGDRPGGQEEHPQRGSAQPPQVPDRREWWEGD